MEIRLLRYFAAVVEAGSFTAAAAELHLSQPTLSAAIAKLETELGVALLVRSPRGVEATSAGMYLLDESSRVLADLDEIARELRRYSEGAVGSLTIAAVPVLMWHRLPKLLREFSVAAPEVELKLVDPPPWTALDMLQQGRVDVAAIMVADHQRFARRHQAVFEIIDWGEVPLVAVLPPGELNERLPDPLPLSSFSGEKLVLPQRTAAVPSLPEMVDTLLAAHGVAPASVASVPTIQTCLPLIEAGLVRAILPDPDYRSLERFDVTVRRLAVENASLRALVLVKRGAAKDPAIARLLRQVVSAGIEIKPDPVRNQIGFKGCSE